jgi:hypothetical protein
MITLGYFPRTSLREMALKAKALRAESNAGQF